MMTDLEEIPQKETMAVTSSYDEWIENTEAIPSRTDGVVIEGEDMRHLFKERDLFATLPVCMVHGDVYVMKTRKTDSLEELLEFAATQFIIYECWKETATGAYMIRSSGLEKLGEK